MVQSQAEGINRPPSSMCNTDSYQLLLIEDIDDVRAIIHLGLTLTAEWRVLTAPSIEDGLAIVRDTPVDLILVDVYVDGTNVLDQIRCDPVAQDIPVIVIISRDRLTDQLFHRQQGAAAVIAKPFDPMTLAQLIYDTLQVKKR
jgi:DNA-binding response OmpR family regulator